MTRYTTTLLAAGALLLGAQAASAQSISWDLANEYEIGSIHGQAAETFSERLEELSSGDIQIMRHHGSSLGYKSVDQFDAVGDGALPLASSYVGPWGGIDPLFLLSSLPFLTPTPDDVWELYQAAKPAYAQVLEDNNQVMLFATPWPPSGLWANQAIDSQDALENLRIRTYDANGTITLRAAGAAPIQLSWADVVPQLTTGGLDGVLTSADGGVGASLWEQQSHFTEVNYASPLQIVHINRDEYDRLSDEQKEWLLEAARAGEEFGWSALRERVAENYEVMRSHGMTVVEEVDPAFLDLLRKAGTEAIEQWNSQLGERGAVILREYEERQQN
ncbi:TRAP transporter substrate-binding protein [Aquibaculum arenosum]|uniref:TRAP transporter substrate-binding protein n=1 Tax=Aquibaculum arenosum TaxID=3032591 RepID=A0ABT5YM10_9PROT|nr:TRAP transporter substrate-binding protein [Fodinicurvata sp. CAU 1616]MDF2096000.1 TRAP transporter substrate-binding protein [Fodinicurvata sp. CAU 1616]